MSAPLQDFEIAIHIGAPAWQKALHDIDSLCAKAVTVAQSQTLLRPFAEISIALLSDKDVQSLNEKYRNKNKPTNVLSFPGTTMDGFTPLLGDIVLGYTTVSAEAKARRIPLRDHVTHLLIHGFYHLQGYNHESNVEAKIMEALEIKALNALGISNPYAKEILL
ncbi:MAG: rRNA maturation RNase YbeY [Robiginitomaculum sp.]